MNLLVKKASALTSEEKINMGLVGIPDDWPIEVLSYNGTDPVPSGYSVMTDIELDALKSANQTAYDAWVLSKQPGQLLSENYKVEEYSPTGSLQTVNYYQDKIGGAYTTLARSVSYTYIADTNSLKQIDNVTYDSVGGIIRHEQTKFYTDTDTKKIITEIEVL